MFELRHLEPLPLESLTSYVRRVARRQLFADPITFLRAGGLEWPTRSRDLDLVTGAALEQIAALLDLEVDRVVTLTLEGHLTGLPEQAQASLRWWTRLTHRARVCDRCVAEQPYGRVHWRIPIITECLVHRRPLLDECRVCGAVRDRSSRRWERFACGHHVDRSAGEDSLPVDLRVQQAIQAALRIGAAPSTEASAWLVRELIERLGRLVEVGLMRATVREIWAEMRRDRAAVHQRADALRVRLELGERMYPTQRQAPVPPGADPSSSPDLLRALMDHFGMQRMKRWSAAPEGPLGTTPTVTLTEPVAG